ncbi:hypothetical protein MASR2M74_00240 [Paracoccaceae bacterium]
MSSLQQVRLTEAERAELASITKKRMNESGVKALLATGSPTITWATGGVCFPYLDQNMVQPVAVFLDFEADLKVIFCSHDLAGIPGQMGWEGVLVPYVLDHASPEASLAAAVAEFLATVPTTADAIGVDGDRMTRGQLTAFRSALPKKTFNDVSNALNAARIRKTTGELRLIEAACRAGDRGFVSALNHTEGAALDTLSYPVWEYGERCRVHVGEFGGSGVGNLVVAQGARARDLYPETDPYATFSKGELVRMEFSAHYAGYWMAGSRTVSVGHPSPEARRSWEDNKILRAAAVDALIVGKRACDVHAAVVAASDRTGIAFWSAQGVGHGVGASEHEAPFLAPFDDRWLSPGMAVAVAVYTYGPNQELICNKDVFEVTDGAPRLLTWYKTFPNLYSLFGTSARHG